MSKRLAVGGSGREPRAAQAGLKRACPAGQAPRLTSIPDPYRLTGREDYHPS
jgi:hypothetical protein